MNNRIISMFLIIVGVVFISGCATTPLDTQTMVGMQFQECVKTHNLEAHKAWWTPNLPPDSDSEVTYFLPKGNLEIHFSNQEKINFATFDLKDTSPDERIKQVYESWGEYVDKKTGKKSNR